MSFVVVVVVGHFFVVSCKENCLFVRRNCCLWWSVMKPFNFFFVNSFFVAISTKSFFWIDCFEFWPRWAYIETVSWLFRNLIVWVVSNCVWWCVWWSVALNNWGSDGMRNDRWCDCSTINELFYSFNNNIRSSKLSNQI